jgi:phosphate:Na+ symporter
MEVSILGVLIQMAGCVALLLWGTHMVGSGVMRVFGSSLRQRVADAMSRPARAFFTGLIVTLGLQSSTAVGLMASSFVARGVLAAEPGYLLMLGANVGTAIVAQILSLPIGALSPLLLIGGWTVFRSSKSLRRKNMGRIALGLGMMLFGLHEMLNISGSVLSEYSWGNLDGISSQLGLVLLIATILGWVCHSSVAVVLLTLSLAMAGVLPLSAAWFAILGANLGGAMPPVAEASSIAERRLPLGNLLVRGVGVALGCWLSPWAIAALSWRSDPHDLMWAHLGFNVCLAILAFPFGKWVTKLVFNLAPDPPVPQDPGQPVHLASASDPLLAVAASEREALRVADLLKQVLSDSAKAVIHGDTDAALRIGQMSDATTNLGASIRRFLGGNETLTNAADIQRTSEIRTFVMSMEHAVDIAEHQLVNPALRRHRELGSFSAPQEEALSAMMHALDRALDLAVAVFLRGDVQAARELVEQKVEGRRQESDWLQRRPTVSGRWDQDIDADLRAMREARRIYGHLAAIAYDLLERSGQLRSRVAPD